MRLAGPAPDRRIGGPSARHPAGVWAVSQLKLLAQKKLKSWIVQENVQGSTSHTWKGMTFCAVQCFRLSYSDWCSTFRIFLPIHKSVGRCNMSHQVWSTDRMVCNPPCATQWSRLWFPYWPFRTNHHWKRLATAMTVGWLRRATNVDGKGY